MKHRQQAIVGARLAGSTAELHALDRIGQWAEACGERPSYEGFVAVLSPLWTVAAHLVLLLLSLGALQLWPPLSPLLLAGTLHSLRRELSGQRGWVRGLIPRGIGYNLVLRRPAEGERRATVLLAASVDQHRRGLQITPRSIAWLQGWVGALLLVTGGLSMGLAVSWWLPFLQLSALLAGLALLITLLLTLTPAVGRAPADGGLAAAWIAWRRLGADPPEGVELVFVALSCEQAHSGGLLALLDQHHTDWSPQETLLLAAAYIGGRELVYGIGEKGLRPVPYRPTLPALAERLSWREPWSSLRGGWLERRTPSAAASRMGYRALTLSSLGWTPSQPERGEEILRCAELMEDLVRQHQRDWEGG